MKGTGRNHSSDAVYGLGLIGAAVYYLSKASGLWAIIIAIVKALLWPAFLVYELMSYLGV